MKTIKIPLGHIDLSSLKTDEDVQRLASDLLPTLIRKVGEAVGEQMWESIQRAFTGPGLSANSSLSDKREFVTEAGRNYQRGISARDRKGIEEEIVGRLRKLRESGEHEGAVELPSPE